MFYIDQKYLLLVSSQLKQFKKKSDGLYNFRCPYCGDSKKSQTKARGFIFRKENSMIYKCHNCGVGASFKNFLKQVDSKIYNEYILERYKKKEVEPDISQFRKPKFLLGDSPLKSLIKVSTLEHNHPVKKFLENRQIPSHSHHELFLAPKFFEWVNTLVPNKFPSLDGDHPRLVIPFFDERDKMFAFQGRAFGKENPKYITIVLDSARDKIYGLNKVDWNKKVFVVEGPIDSLFLDNCIATAQSDLRISYKKQNVVLIPDNEPRNKEIVKQIEKFIDEHYSVVLWPEYVKEKDINDMILSGRTKTEIQKIINENVYSGIKAKTQFVFWKKVELKNEKKLSRNQYRHG
tara:strand:- start:88 stop:1128 length:1041 start_codon:yes stop_codon:yes gene_type:complete